MDKTLQYDHWNEDFFVGILLTLRFVIEDFTDFNPDRLGTIIMDGKNEL